MSGPRGGYRPQRECLLCHRVGTTRFVPSGDYGWVCWNDGACARRAARRVEPLDWLLNFVQATDLRVARHYWHMVDGRHLTCGCPLEGEDDAR